MSKARRSNLLLACDFDFYANSLEQWKARFLKAPPTYFKERQLESGGRRRRQGKRKRDLRFPVFEKTRAGEVGPVEPEFS